jgi:hypothetical protein
MVYGSGGGDEGDCGGGTDDRLFYLKELVNNNYSPFSHIQVHFMRGVLC